MPFSTKSTPSSFVRVRELARGGMGSVEVVLRKEGDFRRLLAVKRLLPEYRNEQSFRDMFLDEARLSGLLRHPNVISVIDVGEDENGPFLVMEFVDGVSLSKVIRAAAKKSEQLPIQVALRIAIDVARGLHAAHELKSNDGTPLEMVHRDVTPQNVLVSYAGHVRVADFGIAKALGRQARTSTGILKGKVGYMSPEQLRFREPDRRSDLFSLGVVLFEALTGKRLYSGEGLEGARRILEEPPPDIGEEREDAADELVSLLFDLLAKDPNDRPASAEETAVRLEAVLAEVRMEEDPLELRDYLEANFRDERLRAREELDVAIRKAEVESAVVESVPAPPVETASGSGAWKWATVSLLALLVVGGALAFSIRDQWLPGSEASVATSIAPPAVASVSNESELSEAEPLEPEEPETEPEDGVVVSEENTEQAMSTMQRPRTLRPARMATPQPAMSGTTGTMSPPRWDYNE